MRKAIQLVAMQGKLYALGEDGRIWVRRNDLSTRSVAYDIQWKEISLPNVTEPNIVKVKDGATVTGITGAAIKGAHYQCDDCNGKSVGSIFKIRHEEGCPADRFTGTPKNA